jgi:hypothetical protein
MLFPTQSLVYFESCGSTQALLLPPPSASSASTSNVYTKLSSDPASIAFVLDDPSLTELTVPQATLFLRAVYHRTSLSSAPYGVSSSTGPLRILAWKIHMPARVILYTGASAPTPSQLDSQVFEPHTLQKVMLDKPSKRPSLSQIQRVEPLSTLGSASDCIRASLKAHASTLAPYEERPGAQSHALEEAVYCFIHPPRRAHHTDIPLNASLSWNKGHIDSRYARVSLRRAVLRQQLVRGRLAFLQLL